MTRWFQVLAAIMSGAVLCNGFSTVPSGTRLRRHKPKHKSSSSSSSLHAQLEAILWDMDGVLADTERDGHRPAFNQAFQEFNLDTVWDVERYGKLLSVGGGKERMTAHWNEVGWPSSIVAPEQRQQIVKDLHLRKTDIFMDFINQKKIPLRPGVLRVIDDAIAAGLGLAVCSTSNEKAVTNLVNTLMGPQRAAKFQIFAGDMVAKKKPAPDVYLMAVDKMGLDKTRCVIVEDSEIGLGAAKAAGISCIVTKSSYTANENFQGADLIVDELGNDPATGITLETLTGLLKGGGNGGPSPPPTPASAKSPRATDFVSTLRPGNSDKVASDNEGLNPFYPTW